MIIRRLTEDDIPMFREMHNSNHDYEYHEPRLEIGSIVVENEFGVVGAGYLKPITEAVMVLNKFESLRTRTIAMNTMIRQAVLDVKSLGLPQVHMWANDPEFSKLLQKHYKCEKLPGDSLILRIK